MIYIVGHKNPDTDSVCAGVALADLFKQRGSDCVPCVNGDLNPETSFVLEKFGLSDPQKLENAAEKNIFLVDHSDTAQGPEGLEKAEIKGIIDHHKLGDITTSSPLEAWIWPVGSTCTVIKSMYDFYGIDVPPSIAGAMLSAILSDTVIFKSATNTPADEKAAEELAGIAGIEDIRQYGIEMFKVKSAIEDSTAEELVQRDYKDFDMNGNKVGIGQLELVDISMVDNIKDNLFAELQKLKPGRHSVILLLTDIMKEGTEMLIVSDDEKIAEKAFGEEIKDNKAWLKDVMSRKKQVVPPLEKAFAD